MATLLRTLSAAEAMALTREVATAVERAECSGLVLPGLNDDESWHLLQRVEQFQRQCQFLLHYGLTSHPCITLGGEAIPLSFSPDEIEDVVWTGAANPASAIASALAVESGTSVDMAPIEEIKKTFAERFVEFVSSALEWSGFGGGGNNGGDDRASYDEAGGIEITVNSNTHGLQVVYSEHFMIRGKKSENAFGESLTSPVKGQITQAGLYYFGTADNETTNWARFTFKIPPTRIVNLMH